VFFVALSCTHAIPFIGRSWLDGARHMLMRHRNLRAGATARRRGFVLVTMAATAAAVFGVVGLAVDIGRMFITKNELQVYCDAAAVAAAMQLDGSTAGLGRARSAIIAFPNKWNFGTTAVTGATAAFAMDATGPWVASPNPASAYSYAQVTAAALVPLYFLPLVTAQSTFNVTAVGAAGQIPIRSLGRGISPYTAVSTKSGATNFGLVVGNSYSIHWPTYNGNRSGCGPSNPGRCFNSDPCPGDDIDSQMAVVNNWATKYHGYWGSNSNSVIAAQVLNTIQMAPVAMGDNIDSLLTAGNKQSEAGILDERASQDTNTDDDTPAAYLASSNHNGRRLLPVAIVNPVDPDHTIVIGFGQFLLQANGSPSNYYKKNSNGNSPYCATYAGPYNVGSTAIGAGGDTGAASVRLVQ